MMDTSQPFKTQTSLGQQGGGMQEGAEDPPVDLSEFISYVEAVKQEFADQPEVYHQFIDVLKAFKNQRIDTRGVVERVAILFHGHPVLLRGFNMLLPPIYQIETGENVDQLQRSLGVRATHDTNVAYKLAHSLSRLTL